MQTTLHRPRPYVAARRTGLDFLALCAFLLLLTAAIGLLAWQFWHSGRIYTGVAVAGVPIGGMTRTAALARLHQELTPYPLQPVSLVYDGQRWPITVEQLVVRPDLMDATNRAYLMGREGHLWANLGLQWQMVWSGYTIRPGLEFDLGQIRYLVSQIGSEVRQAPRPAGRVDGVVVEPRSGLDVDVAATADRLLDALARNQAAVVPLQVIELPPPSPAPASGQGRDGLLQRPLRLVNALLGLDLALDPTEVAMVVRSLQPLQLNEELLRSLLARWAPQIELPARDARLRFDPLSGQLSVLRPSQTGRQLEIDGAVEAVRQALSAGVSVASLPVTEIAPAVDMRRLDALGIRELVIAGTTTFGGSSAARIKNIEVAATKFDGVVIPPGEIFSFNGIIEDVSAANGFEDSLIIWGDRTAVGVGGGVCQVSTTVFRAAYQGGFPIVERYNHGYVVDWYGEPGLDATIYTPTVDFRFRNNTEAHLLVQPEVDSARGVIAFHFYGTKPNRTVTIGAPVVTDVTPPPPPIYQTDSSLAQGQIRQMEHAQDGMTVIVERTVTENGVSRRDQLVSRYQPWQAVYLVGPGTTVPGGATATTADQ